MRVSPIIGCQRSGTALLRLVLDSHPRVRGLGEERAYDALEQGFVPETPVELLVVPIPIWTELLVDYPVVARLVGEETPLLFMVRDVRDVVASMKRLPNWIDVEVVAKFDAWLSDRGRRFAPEHGREVERWRGNRLAWAAIYWKYKTSTLFRLLDAGRPVLPVRYERLVGDPVPTLRRVVGHLGLPWHDDLLRHHLLPHGEVGPSGIAMGDTRADRPIDATSVGRWRTELSPDEVETVLAIAGALDERVRVLSSEEVPA